MLQMRELKIDAGNGLSRNQQTASVVLCGRTRPASPTQLSRLSIIFPNHHINFTQQSLHLACPTTVASERPHTYDISTCLREFKSRTDHF